MCLQKLMQYPRFELQPSITALDQQYLSKFRQHIAREIITKCAHAAQTNGATIII